MTSLQGRVAFVTGAACGIGRAIAIRLAQAGAVVTAADLRNRPENGPEFQRLGITAVECDVRDLAALEREIEASVQRGGRLDILVNNAGVTMTGQLPEICEEDWDRCLDTNLKAAFFGVKFALPHLKRAGGGAVVNMASNAGLLPRAHDPVYSISKLALVGLTKSLALCHARDRIRVNCVCPGPVSGTDIMNDDLIAQPDPQAAAERVIAASPLAKAWNRMMTPEEIAEAVLYLVSDAACMVTGTSLAIDGGKSLGVPPATA